MIDPVVRLETLAVACNVALNTIRRARLEGHIPAPDTLYKTPKSGQPARAWKLSTIRAWKLSTLCAWNPAVADRCAAILRALETIPLDAA